MRPSQRLGAGRGPRGKGGKGGVGPRGQAGRRVGARGDGQGVRRGMGSGAPPHPDVQSVQCILPGIQQIPEHHAHRHHHHYAHFYNINPDAGDLGPTKTPRTPLPAGPPTHGGAPRGPAPAERVPRAEPARMAAAPGARRRCHRCRSRRRSKRGRQRGPGAIRPGTGTRSRTPWGARPSPWRWRCMGG